MSLLYSSRDYHESVIHFPDLYVESPGEVTIYLESSPLAVKEGLGPGQVEFFSTASEPSQSDGIYALYRDDKLVDFIFYSNRDGNVLSSMMSGSLRDYYRLGRGAPLAGLPSYYPINGYNDDYLQGEAVDLSGPRSGDSLQKIGGVWILREFVP